jgi:hypothetical protein
VILAVFSIPLMLMYRSAQSDSPWSVALHEVMSGAVRLLPLFVPWAFCGQRRHRAPCPRLAARAAGDQRRVERRLLRRYRLR